jgi:hypothetical protein
MGDKAENERIKEWHDKITGYSETLTMKMAKSLTLNYRKVYPGKP